MKVSPIFRATPEIETAVCVHGRVDDVERNQPVRCHGEHLPGWQSERPVADAARPSDQVRVRTGAPRSRGVRDILRGHSGDQSVRVNGESDVNLDPVRVALLRNDGRSEQDSVRGLLQNREILPAQQTVQGVPALRLGQRELTVPSVEVVSAIDNPIRPRCERCSTVGRSQFVRRVRHHEVSTVVGQRSQRSADRCNGRPIASRFDRALTSGQWIESHEIIICVPVHRSRAPFWAGAVVSVAGRRGAVAVLAYSAYRSVTEPGSV
jgi:hypothetical protein